MWILWCCFKQLAVVKVFSHSKHMYSLTPVCFFYVLSNFAAMKNSLHANDINMASPLYELSDAVSGLKPTQMFCRTDHMCVVSLQCGSFHVFSELMTDLVTVWTHKVSLQCESSHVFSGLLSDCISCRSINTYKVFLQCVPSHVFSGVLSDWISCRSINT